MTRLRVEEEEEAHGGGGAGKDAECGRSLPSTSSASRRAPGMTRLRVEEVEAHGGGGAGKDAECGRSLNQTASFLMNKGTFVRQDVAIWEGGVALKDSTRAPLLVCPEALQLGPVIGRGASSYVQHAVHSGTGQPLALKVINVFDKSKRDQLIREITTLYDADCDALVSFMGAFTREGAIVLALEYMDCGSLADLVGAHGAVPEPVLAGIAFQALWGLAYLRVEKRLHRDLKPGNVLLSSTGAVKLADFGLSAELANSIGMAQTYVGTCKYMAPERISHHGYSFPSDIWSAGLLLLEAALAQFPLPEASSYIDMVCTIVECPDVLDLPPGTASADGRPFTAEFRDFLTHCLQKNPEARWSAEALLAHPFLACWGVTDLDSACAMVASYLAVMREVEAEAAGRGARHSSTAPPPAPQRTSIGGGRTTTTSHSGGLVTWPSVARAWTLPLHFQAAAQEYASRVLPTMARLDEVEGRGSGGAGQCMAVDPGAHGGVLLGARGELTTSSSTACVSTSTQVDDTMGRLE